MIDFRHQIPRLLASCFFLASISFLFLVFKGGLVSQVTSMDRMFPDSFKSLPSEVALALVHYVVSNITPQQSREEIMLSVNVLAKRAPCNFLVFGLGHDSLMWKSLNYGGRTVFLEESDDWIKQIVSKHPNFEAYLVDYKTMLKQSDQLLEYSRSKRSNICRPVQKLQRSKCDLALNNLPKTLYNVEWDVIMIDAPRGYFPEAPGRMKAIFSAGVLARSRKGNGTTDIYLHDVDRPVERIYAEEFLCRENLVAEAPGRRLWHFNIAPTSEQDLHFCKKH
ncbi:hypothetical protein O6H91_01G016600 [Diphasiastrum complanatum]|nr:hypothetical protein O6H91_01G016600 [Diphasiastrum complanatum]